MAILKTIIYQIKHKIKSYPIKKTYYFIMLLKIVRVIKCIKNLDRFTNCNSLWRI